MTEMDRREALILISRFLGGIISAPVAAALLSGCTATNADSATGVLQPDRLKLAGTLAERIIPTTDTPGALTVGVDRYIAMAVSQFFRMEERELYLNGLDKVNDMARSMFANDFVDCSMIQQNQMLTELDSLAFGNSSQFSSDLARFFRLHKELTVVGYYTSEIGQTEELHITPYGSYEADVPLSEIGKAWA